MRSPLATHTIIALALALALGSIAAADVPVPDSLTYKGIAVDESGKPLEGSHDLRFGYLDREGATELFTESHPQVTFEEGRFEVVLGTGLEQAGGALPSLRRVFEKNPELLMEVSIDGQTQNPWVRIFPAGHSQATTAALSGPVGSNSQDPHWKGYESKSTQTGIQAVLLGPADDNAAGPVPLDSRRLTNPLSGDGWFLGESLPLRDQPAIDATARPEFEVTEINPPRHEDLYDDEGRRFGTTTEKIRDPLAAALSAPGATPSAILNFEGVGNVNSVVPPDTEGTVGPNHYIQVVNLSFAIYDKTGTLLGGPWNTNTLWSGTGNACQVDNSGDAIFLYDEAVDRFILTQFAVNSGQAVCFAVSQTGDPLGSYWLYQFNSVRFPDYYKLGVWPVADNNAYFMGTNTGFGGQYDVYAFERSAMLTGSAATWQVFQNHPNLMMPADVDGAAPPPAGSPGIMYTFRDGGEPYFGNPPTDSLDIWEFDVDWTTPANSTFTNVQSFIPPDLAPFNWSVCGFFVSNCLPQPGTTRRIDSASWWPMQRLVYRKFGAHETLVGTWTVDVNGTPDLAGLRWFELRRASPAGLWSIYQQGTHAPDSTHRFMPSIAMDSAGNIAIGYSVTSGSIFPSIRYAVRTPGDTLGTLQTEAELIAGTGSQTGASRWGDYSSMEVDPADDCTFWFTTEYLVTSGGAPWRTRVGTFQVPGCSAFIFQDGFESGSTGDWSQTTN